MRNIRNRRNGSGGAKNILTKKEIEEYLEKAKNKVCGEYIYAYPPGSPIIAPGEIISDKFVYQIKKLYESSVNILSDSNLLPLKILTKK